MVADGKAAARRLPRAERREQILAAATRAFARAGYAATGLDQVAAEAGVTHVIVYRHFASKADLYRAVLDRAKDRLSETVGRGTYDEAAIPALLRAASDDPDGFRLLFRHAAREPEFRDVVDGIRAASTEIAQRHLAEAVPEGPWQDWAASLIPTVVLEAVIAWLDAGRPDPEHAPGRIGYIVGEVIQAARSA
ncbi:TetR/AcrR family transcriptional regulator [Amycolatopsis alkalitolerans]|uniref:TetR/AcrR family transcriptional regulator n=1 Tax=Amycolatopsis alkalitolerans TaxID=2547244 RepID=A0A5C4LZZ8_9PSEU|nr:TetR/AcrR family transcriptional regulator [Amycolatopsis alkalitolerans]TNC24089.1 TetR/AcrR family transcriptional regulator [Amycolatopsis alkalitolerans]